MGLKLFKEYGVNWQEGRLNEEFVYGIDGLKLWIERALKRQNKRFAYEGFGVNYGNNLDNFLGKPLNLSLVKLIEADVKECLCANPYIESVTLLSYEIKGATLTLDFSIKTIYNWIEISEVYKNE